MAKRHERTLARRMAVQALYQSEITGEPTAQIIATGAQLPEGGTLPEYSIVLLQGIDENKDQIDRLLADSSENWSVERMPVVDHAIMRLAVYEMLFNDEVPVSVSINEAVELAKSFGGEDDSARFANGILGRIARMMEAGQTAQDESAAAMADVDVVAPETPEAAESDAIAPDSEQVKENADA